MHKYIFRLIMLLTVSAAALVLSQPVSPSLSARRAAEQIRAEALLPPNSPEGRPLPLASHWNTGRVKHTFEPAHQVELLQQGHRILPWFAWPSGDPASERFTSYYEPLLKLCRELKLPISFRGTQWNAMLVKKEYREKPLSQWAGAVTPEGERKPVLSPFGAIEPWKDPARTYVDTPAMKRIQELYPDPPLILWVSNNEPPELRWKKHGPLEEQSKRYLEKYGPGRSDSFKRRVFGEGWIKRYTVMFNAMRNALAGATWKKNVRFIGYGAFGPSHFGRWSGWKVYSLICDQWTAPDWHYWDGGSPSYYTHNWNDNRDHWVFSTQVQSMNWLFMLQEAWRANPDFWFEISAWDGNSIRHWMEGVGAENAAGLVRLSSRPLSPEKRNSLDQALLKNSKTLQYLKDGQSYPPERTAGWIQFGMWLLRPRVVREFRSHTTPLAPVKPYWMEVVKAVDRVYRNPVLEKFWRRGRLVANRAHRHPYQTDVPERYRTIGRWFLLDTSLDPERPWNQTTTLPVFSLALVLGSKPGRTWLLYAHSPLKTHDNIEITIPGFTSVAVHVARSGAFFVVEEKTGSIKRVTDFTVKGLRSNQAVQ